MTEILVKHISGTLSISKSQVSNTVKLLEEGATIPFISRYRKEATGSLDETEVTAIEKEWKRLLELVKRREAILKSINDQELLTPELKVKNNNTHYAQKRFKIATTFKSWDRWTKSYRL